MASSNDGGPEGPKESGPDKSLVGKLVSGLLSNTPLSKWFGNNDDSPRPAAVRQREEDDDDYSYVLQPPVKRVKLPLELHDQNALNHASSYLSAGRCSNSPELVAGPSGVRSRKPFSGFDTVSASSGVGGDVANGADDSDSEESTSGYSSAPRVAANKKAASNEEFETLEKPSFDAKALFRSTHDNSRSLFSERNLSPHMNTSLSARRPAFNASMFGSPNFVDRTLATKKIMNSPFYSGHTTFGGASAAYGSKLGKSSSDLNVYLKNSVQIRPVNQKSVSDGMILSKTARRILSTLEQYSTPVSDAKKIPVTVRNDKQKGILSRYVGVNPYLIRETRTPSNKELQVPTIPELLQLKQKQRLQNSTESVRQMATTSKSALNKEEFKTKVEYSGKQTKHSNKMKSSVSSLRQKQRQKETVVEVNLPKVSLPITMLPKFDLVIPPPQTATSHSGGKSIKDVEVGAKNTKATAAVERKTCAPEEPGGFKFSSPVAISGGSKTVSPINCFKFSDPLLKKQKNGTIEKSDSMVSKPTEQLSAKNDFKVKNNGENVPGQPVADESKNNKESLSSLNKFKPTAGSWECSVCLVRNEASREKCVACESARVQRQPQPVSGFGDRFKMAADKWECGSCMVRNDNSKRNCVACMNPKPGADVVKSGPVHSTGAIGNKDEPGLSVDKKSASAPAFSFGDAWKPASDSWTCGVCLIVNKNDRNECAACESARDPKSTGDKFKALVNKETAKPVSKSSSTFTFGVLPAETLWECKTCLVKNKPGVKKCTACEEPKDDAKPESEGFGDAFKLKVDEWECSSCLVRNKQAAVACSCCGVPKPGNSNSEKLAEVNEKKPIVSFNFGVNAGTEGFKFGVPPPVVKDKKAEENVPTFLFGDPSKTAPPSTGFTFGVKPSSEPTPSASIDKPAPAVQSLKPAEKLPEEVPVGFTFGVGNVAVPKPDAIGKITVPLALAANPEPPPKPTFDFKPAAVNGNAAKTGNLLFAPKPADSSPFSNPPVVTSSSVAAPPVFKFEPKAALIAPAPPAATSNPVFKNQQAVFNKQPAVSSPVFNAQPNPAKRSFEQSAVKPIFSAASNGFSPSSFQPLKPPTTTAAAAGFGVPENKPFSFGNSGDPPSKVAAFSFGQPDKMNSGGGAAAATPSFKFGNSEPNVVAPPGGGSGFNFSMTSVPNAGFSFGKSEAPEAPVNVFGAATGGAGAKNGSFNFGAAPNNNNQKAVFTFGAGQTGQPGGFAAPSQPPPGFNFSAPMPNAPAAGGFNFAGAPPSFNFMDGSGASAQPQRKFRKAFRRTHR